MEFEDSDEVSSDKGSKGMENSVSESDSSVGSIMAERDSRALVVASPVIDRIAFMAFRMLSRISSLSGDSLKNLKVAACEWLDERFMFDDRISFVDTDNAHNRSGL